MKVIEKLFTTTYKTLMGQKRGWNNELDFPTASVKSTFLSMDKHSFSIFATLDIFDVMLSLP